MSGYPQLVDAIVVGSGPAGCAAALSLARARRSVLVITTHQGRNYTSASSHLWPTREGASPAELEAIRQKELEGYPEVSFLEDSVERLSQLESGLWQAHTKVGTAHLARKVILATGLKDVLPDVQGLEERWGREVQSCLFCHGYEAAQPGAKLVVVGETEQDVFTAASLSLRHSENVTLLTNSQQPPAWGPMAQAAAMCVSVVGGRVSSASHIDGGIGLDVEGGRRFEAATAFVHTRTVQFASGLIESLGVEVDDESRVIIQSPTSLTGEVHDARKIGSGATSVAGVFAAGEMTNASGGKQMIIAAAHGVTVGIQVVENLWEEDLKMEVGAKMQATLANPAAAEAMPAEQRAAMMTMAAQLGLNVSQ